MQTFSGSLSAQGERVYIPRARWAMLVARAGPGRATPGAQRTESACAALHDRSDADVIAPSGTRAICYLLCGVTSPRQELRTGSMRNISALSTHLMMISFQRDINSSRRSRHLHFHEWIGNFLCAQSSPNYFHFLFSFSPMVLQAFYTYWMLKWNLLFCNFILYMSLFLY